MIADIIIRPSAPGLPIADAEVQKSFNLLGAHELRNSKGSNFIPAFFGAAFLAST
jgi:hypothetical protein